MKIKDTSIFRILQSTSFAMQLFQVGRYGALLVGAMAMTWFSAQDDDIDRFEAMMLLGGSCSFFWLGGLLDAFLLLQKKADPLHTNGILARTSSWMGLLSFWGALCCFWVAYLFYPHIETGFVGFFALYWLLETFTQLFPYAMIAKDRPGQLVGYSILYVVGYIGAIGVPLACGWSFGTIVICLYFVGMLRFFWMTLLLRPWVRKAAIEKGTSKEIWRLGLPLMLATLLSQSAVYVDGYLVQEFFPSAFVDFRYGAKEFPLVLLLANSVSIVRGGEIAASGRTGKLDEAFGELRKASSRLIWTMFPVSILFLLISGPVFEVAFQGRFPLAVPIFDLFLLLAIPRLMFPQSVVRGYHQTFAMTMSAGVELVLNVAFSLLFMQFFGLAGIAMGTVMAYFLEKLILLAYTELALGISWRRYASVPLWLGWSLALVVVWLIKYRAGFS